MANIPVKALVDKLLTSDITESGDIQAHKTALANLGAAVKGTASIVAADLATDAVTTAKILDANVTAAKLAANAVTTAKLADGAVTAAKTTGVQASLVSGTNIRTVNGSTLLGSTDLVISGGTPADGSITTAKLADGAVTAAKVSDAALPQAKTAGLSVAIADRSRSTYEGAVLPRTRKRISTEAVAGAIRPFRVKQLSLGDSYAVNLSEQLDNEIAPLREVGFGLTHTVVPNTPADLNQWTRTPNGGTLYRMTGAGQSVQYGGTADTECYRVKTFYQTENGGGTFKIQTNIADAGWVDINQVEEIALSGAITTTGSLLVTVTIGGVNTTLNVPVVNGDLVGGWCSKVRTALASSGAVNNLYIVGGAGNKISLMRKTAPAAVADETMVVGSYYRIVSVGDTNFTALGAAANTVGLVFLKNSATSYGTGTVVLMAATAAGAVADETMVVGSYYRIVSVGDTNFTALGAAANTVGLVFLKNSATSYGTGTVVLMATTDAPVSITVEQGTAINSSLPISSYDVVDGAGIINTNVALGSGATATVTDVSGVITAITIVDGGSGYVSGSVGVAIGGGAGTGAMGLATVSNGAITSISVVRGGTGYSSPTVEIQGVGVGICTFDFASTEPRKVRALWQTGTVRILGFVLSDIREELTNSRGGSAIYEMSAGGQDVANWAQCPQNIWNTIIRDLEPDFITLKGDDSNWNGVCDASPTGLYGKLKLARDMDWIFIGRHPASALQYDGQSETVDGVQNTNSGRELLAMDRQMRAFALDQGQLWINPRQILPPYSEMTTQSVINGDVAAVARLTGDDTHLSTAGGYVQAQAIINILKTALIDNSKMYKGATQSFARLPRFAAGALSLALPSGKAAGLALVNRTGIGASGTNFRPLFGINKMGDEGEFSINYGYSDECRITGNRFGGLFLNNGTGGFGSGLPATPRNATGLVELYSDNRIADPVLTLSSIAGHNGDIMVVRQAALTTIGNTGTRRAGITAQGAADFASVRTTPTTVALLAALVNTTSGGAVADETMVVGSYYRIVSVGDTNFTALGATANTVGLVFSKNAANSYGTGTVVLMAIVAGTESYVIDGSVVHAGNSGTVVAGGGNNFLPVYYDGTYWRIR